MNPEEAENFDSETDNQQNPGSSQPQAKLEWGLRIYYGFQNFTSLKWSTLWTVS